jgi:hypothetical protein
VKRDLVTIAVGLAFCFMLALAILNLDAIFPPDDRRYFPCLLTCAFAFLVSARLARLGWVRQ